jgi:hypothetical protein
MSKSSTPPGALSAKEFALHVTEVGQWIWGTAQGAFNEKQTLAQIMTDAAIGMIPVVGDVTASRDLIAVTTGLATSPEKREHKSEWVLLVILVFALIPVLGGVIKGVGRITLRVTETAIKDSAAAAKIADELVMFLNRIGHKNAEAWLKALDLIKYQGEILTKFRGFCDVMIVIIFRFGLRFKSVLPRSLIARMEQLSAGLKQLKELGDRMIPSALKDLHERLETLKKYIHAGGVPPPNRAATIFAQTGRKTVTYAEEARLIESGAAKKIVRAGKYEQNLASAHPSSRADINKIYRHEPGFPDLLKNVDVEGEFYPAIAAASGKIKNELLSGEVLFRAFGPEGVTHGKTVGKSKPIGAYWGRGHIPVSGEKWRGPWAVLDEFNRNGWLAKLDIPTNVKIPACTSTVSEQFSKEIAGQYLVGGSSQAVVEAFFEKEIITAAESLFLKGGGETVLSSGMKLEVRKSGWLGVNGEIGYDEVVIPGAAMLERLGATEQQTKLVHQATQAKAKSQRVD